VGDQPGLARLRRRTDDAVSVRNRFGDRSVFRAGDSNQSRAEEPGRGVGRVKDEGVVANDLSKGIPTASSTAAVEPSDTIR
jgi:hypothetical protein